MGHHRRTTAESIGPDELSLPERLAIWALRCVDYAPRPCLSQARGVPSGLGRDLQPVITQLRAFQMRMHAQGWNGLRLGAWGSLALSRDERRLLRIIAACQAGDTDMADNLLFRFAPSRPVRLGLTQGVAALAATLAAGGHWLPPPAAIRPLPAGALTVARMHGADPADLQIAWP